MSAFAGYFEEVDSGMSYRLWEQVGHEPTIDSVALYEGECPARIAALERENVDLKELLREIRDGEVNAEDEADKFLRDYQPSELSIARAENAKLRAHIQKSADLTIAKTIQLQVKKGKWITLRNWHLAVLQLEGHGDEPRAN